MFYFASLAYIVMLVIPKIAGGINTEQTLIVYLIGLLPIGIILFLVFNKYVDVFVDRENQRLIVKKIMTNKELVLKKEQIIAIKPLGILYRSPTYIIKYAKERKTGYYFFTKSLLIKIENEIGLFT
jgi:hypothetical protein